MADGERVTIDLGDERDVVAYTDHQIEQRNPTKGRGPAGRT